MTMPARRDLTPPDLYQPATTQLRWLRDGDITSVQLLDAYLERYAAVDGPVNAITATDIEGARRQAADSDRRRAAGEELGVLAGLPMTVKDVYDVDGLPAVAGVPKLAKRSSRVDDAVVVARLKAAGAVIWGKTNTPYMAADVQTYNKVYGVTNNPYDLSRTPGGSSGGAAAALAAALTPLEVGSDIGGSLRTPSHNCGVCALKPTHGRIPLVGHVPPSPGFVADPPDLAVAGPMARNMEDLGLLFSVLADSTPPKERSFALSDLRIARWEEPSFATSHATDAALGDLVGALQRGGAQVTSASPDIDATELLDVSERLLLPIITEEMPALVRRVFSLARPLARRFVKPGQASTATAFVAATQSPTEIAAARRQREELKAACETFFDTFDVLLAPVTSVPAIPHDTSKLLHRRTIDIDGSSAPYASLFQWISLATVCHLPAAVIPLTRTTAGLPIGVQIIGREGADFDVMAIAQLIAERIGDPGPPPKL